MLNTEVLLEKHMEDLEELAISQCPGIHIGSLGMGEEFWRNSIKLSKKFWFFYMMGQPLAQGLSIFVSTDPI